MKVKIKSFVGELPEYFKIDEVYDVKHRSEYTFFLDDDEGDRWICLYDNCPHLNGGSWEVVEWN